MKIGDCELAGSNRTAVIAQIALLDFLAAAKGNLLKTFHFHLFRFCENIRRFAFSDDLLTLLPNVEFLSFSNDSLFQRPSALLLRLQVMYLGTLDIFEEMTTQTFLAGSQPPAD